MDIGAFDGDRQQVKPISAAEARRKVRGRTERTDDRNYTLTIRRLYKIIDSAAADGYDSIHFVTPSFVLDGSICDPILLAKQLKARLVKLGYKVQRNQERLRISWAEDED